ncbi:MAG TPA: hypothetical protein VFO40_02400 [Chthoniobacterales bacterium]|nr:hypothetical protein [Chthoniobacterales bacterium]
MIRKYGGSIALLGATVTITISAIDNTQSQTRPLALHLVPYFLFFHSSAKRIK